ncbi:MAG: signal peptidase II [Brevundimonas sp.]|uniref:signal peptidase II n=1 Tax=Brevundimonas sp. TaxID=1871086 RepID=UPI0026128B35|nr:signal peptidase II [Brevundimonas sp.]MDI6623474.1 signal peptidase II [Brevundimonas sp.]MDQ7812565.1 signal peptidase II [Brevundimonas sp.]
MKIPRIALAAYGFAILIVVVDQLTKAWIISGLDLRMVGQIPILPPVLNFTWVENRGVSFGLFGDGSARWMLSVFSVVVAGVLGWWALRADRRMLVSAIGLIMGGAIGNVIDRIRFGFVVDFLDFSGTGFFPWVFNVADSAITVGVILLILDSVLSEKAAKVGVAAEKS